VYSTVCILLYPSSMHVADVDSLQRIGLQYCDKIAVQSSAEDHSVVCTASMKRWLAS